MRIREITVRELQMKLVTPFETSMDRTDVKRFLLIQADVDGVAGWGECVAGGAPFYSPETTDTAWHILRDFLDRKSTRLNSSHQIISYAVFCLKKKTNLNTSS